MEPITYLPRSLNTGELMKSSNEMRPFFDAALHTQPEAIAHTHTRARHAVHSDRCWWVVRASMLHGRTARLRGGFAV
jgi:hypothetical protein